MLDGTGEAMQCTTSRSACIQEPIDSVFAVVFAAAVALTLLDPEVDVDPDGHRIASGNGAKTIIKNPPCSHPQETNDLGRRTATATAAKQSQAGSSTLAPPSACIHASMHESMTTTMCRSALAMSHSWCLLVPRRGRPANRRVMCVFSSPSSEQRVVRGAAYSRG